MKMKAAMFDLDGTLVHTKPEYRYDAVGSTFKELGIRLDKKEIDRFWWGMERDKIISSWNIDPKIFWNIFQKYDNPKIRDEFTSAYKDCSVLKKLQKSGIKMGVVSGAPLHIVEMELKKVGIDFDSIVIATESHGIRIKPDPHGILECLKILNVHKKEAIFVGNGEEDVHAAQAAGVYDILIERGEHELNKNLKPTKRIKTLHEILSLIEC